MLAGADAAARQERMRTDPIGADVWFDRVSGLGGRSTAGHALWTRLLGFESLRPSQIYSRTLKALHHSKLLGSFRNLARDESGSPRRTSVGNAQGRKPSHQIARGLLPGVRHQAILDGPCLENAGQALSDKGCPHPLRSSAAPADDAGAGFMRTIVRHGWESAARIRAPACSAALSSG